MRPRRSCSCCPAAGAPRSGACCPCSARRSRGSPPLSPIRPVLPAVHWPTGDRGAHARLAGRAATSSRGRRRSSAAFRRARAALAASGTVTLELALAGVPMVGAYQVGALEIRILRGARSRRHSSCCRTSFSARTRCRSSSRRNATRPPRRGAGLLVADTAQRRASSRRSSACVNASRSKAEPGGARR